MEWNSLSSNKYWGVIFRSGIFEYSSWFDCYGNIYLDVLYESKRE